MRHISTVLLTILFLVCSRQGRAQDSLEVKAKRKWYVPDFLALQYAGSIGFLSAGAGYDIFRHKANVDVLVGYLPASIGGETLETITLKFTAAPVKVKITPKVTAYPFTIGTYFCYTPGSRYSSDLPSWYPSGYYWWSEAIRVNLFIGGNVRFASDPIKQGSKASFYYEVGTNEIKMVSYIQNRSALNIWSILHAGIGVRYHFAE
jgi:hypothetical protein